MALKTRRRNTLRSWLVSFLLATILAWSDFADISPYQGWIARAAVSTVHSYQRKTAGPACYGDELEKRELKGITVRYPSCFQVLLAFSFNERGDNLGVFGPRGLSAYTMMVTETRSADLEKFRRSWVENRAAPIDIYQNSGWEVRVYGRKGQDELMSADLFGATHHVSIAVTLEKHMVGTELDRYMREDFKRLVQDICTQNRQSILAPSEAI